MPLYLRRAAAVVKPLLLAGIALGLTASLVPGAARADDPKPVASAPGVGLTIYSSADPAGFDPQQFVAQQRQGYNPQFAWQVPGFGVVRDVRELDLKAGENSVKFTDVAEFIDPTTVSLVDLSGGEGVSVSQQKFVFDLVSPQKLLEKYIDKKVTVNVNIGEGKREAVTGTLLSANYGQMVIQTSDGIRVLSGTGDVQLGALPGGLVTRPTLQWDLSSPAAGKRLVRTAYQTSGITWRSDYNLVLNADDTTADLGAWVTVLNMSGAAYPNASLKLIAGDVQRIQRNANWQNEIRYQQDAMKAGGGGGFEEKAFFEYHMYTLPQKVTIDADATQQLVLFPTVRGVKVEKVLVYSGAMPWQGWGQPNLDRNLGSETGSKKVDVYIRFDNKPENNLGIPLPKGKVRVYKIDAAAPPADQTSNIPGPKASGGGGDGAMEFIGEDLIDHTAKNEQVLVKLGQSFDVTGQRVQTKFEPNKDAKQVIESFKITLKNAKDKAQKVVIRENLYRWSKWEITDKSDAFKQIDSHTVHFEVDVPPGGEKTVTYTVKYTW